MGAMIQCCECGGQFDERTLQGSWLNRHCPKCGALLSEERYDAHARVWLDKHPRAQDTRQLDGLALGRYYTSEWFRLACAGKGSESADKGLFGLSMSYAHDGAFQLIPDDEDRSPEGGWGVSAEFRVFDALRAEIVRQRNGREGEGNPESGSCTSSAPLANARLVPHLTFPWLPGQKPKQWGAKHRAEIDCVLLAPSFAVIVEVKRRTHHVRVPGRFQNIRERTDDGKFRSANEVLEQVINGAEAFAERQRLYPEGRIYRLIVYVDPHSFECPNSRFHSNTLVSYLDDGGAHFIGALEELAAGMEPIAGKRDIKDLADRLMADFGNTSERKVGRIVYGRDERAAKKYRRAAGMLQSVKQRCADPKSPLNGAQLLEYPACEVEMGKRGKPLRTKRVDLTGLLLTRTHAVLIVARPWPVHVNTHVPFATVYTGEPRDGAKHVEDAIRHDWDLEEIHYLNRSGALTLLTYVGKNLDDVERYRERNRVCTLNVFLNPTSFYSDCDEFRSRTFAGFWRKGKNNIMGALEGLAVSAEPIMTQEELEEFADSLRAIGVEQRD